MAAAATGGARPALRVFVPFNPAETRLSAGTRTYRPSGPSRAEPGHRATGLPIRTRAQHAARLHRPAGGSSSLHTERLPKASAGPACDAGTSRAGPSRAGPGLPETGAAPRSSDGFARLFSGRAPVRQSGGGPSARCRFTTADWSAQTRHFLFRWLCSSLVSGIFVEELNRAAAVRIEAGRPDYRAGGQRAPRPVSGGGRQAPGPPPRLGQGAIFFLFCFDGA